MERAVIKPPSRDETDLRYEGWRVALAGATGVFLASLFVYTFGMFLKPLSEEFSWSREEVSSAYGMAAFMSAVFATPLGLLLDRYRPTVVIVPCVIAVACGFVSLWAMTPHLWHLYATFAVLGVAATGMSAMGYSRAVSSWFTRRRGMALALVVSGGAIAGLVHPPLADYLMGFFGWRGANLVFALVVLAVGLPTIAGVVRERSSVSPSAIRTDTGSSVAEGLVSRVFWIQALVLFVSAGAQNSAIVHLSPLLTDRGVAPSQAALAMSAMGGGSLVGRLLTGWLLDRFFAPYVSFALLAIAASGTFLLSYAETFAVGALAAACIGFGMGGESDVTPYLFSRYFGLRSFSTFYGLTWTATGIAAAMGPILMGRAFDATGSYESLLSTLALATLVVALLLFGMPDYDSVPPRGEPSRARPTRPVTD
jgi:predicted MFS family arabinose efflux permease